MTSGAGLLVMMLHLVSGGNTTPDTLNLTLTKIVCKDILYTFSKDGYKYIGISAGTKNYLTNYENSDTLQEEINKQCKK